MKTSQNRAVIHTSHALHIVLGVGILLLIPLILTLTGSGVEGDGWHWTPRDFVFGFVMLFGTGLALDYAIRRFRSPKYRAIVCGAITLAFLLIWGQLAVGIFD